MSSKMIRNVALTLGLSLGSWAVEHSMARPDEIESGQVETVSDSFAGVWTVSAVPTDASAEAGATAFAEEVLFHDGKFSAAAFAMMGFSTTDYTLSDHDGSQYFAVTLSSDDRGTLAWAGRLTDDGFTGLLLWTRADGEVYRYRIVGERR
jgi:hypothetical protein